MIDLKSFISKLEQVPYNAALAITGAIKCASHSKLYNELGLGLWNPEEDLGVFVFSIK